LTDNDFVRLLNQHRGYLYRAARAITGNETDAMDALQEASLKGFIAREQLRGGQEAFRPWMKRIVLHCSLAVVRQREKIVPLGGREDVVPDTAPTAGSEMESDVWEAVAALPAALRETVALRYVYDLSQEQVSQTLNIPLGTVKSRLNRALEHMRSGLLSRRGELADETVTR
jgi:RNA polymerase sigma-70 factor (ECF subfamily)